MLSCLLGHKGGALLINSADSISILVDVIFEADTAFEDTGNIFSTTSSAVLFLFNMPTPRISNLRV